MNIAGHLLRAGRQFGHTDAVRSDGRAVSYEELSRRARTLAALFLSRGLKPGDRVAVFQNNSIEFVECMFAVWLAGLVFVPINSRASIGEAAFIVEHSAASMLIHDKVADQDLAETLGATTLVLAIKSVGPSLDQASTDHGAIVEDAVEVSPDDVAWLFYTSGTTGKPKGAMLSHRNLRQMVMSHLADVQAFGPGEKVLHAAPLTHGSGLILLSAVARGACNVIYPGSSFKGSDVLSAIEEDGIEAVAFLAPTQIINLVQAADGERRAATLESVCYGGAPMFVEDMRRALEIFGPVFVQIYGQGEAPMTITALTRPEHEWMWRSGDSRLGSVGLPRTDVEVKIARPVTETESADGTGEILVRGDVVMLGYWDDAGATETAIKDGWLRTGDIGRIDERGYLFLLDRSKDMIISGGNNIYPREVEEVILQRAEVQAVAVVGVPDGYWGESVKAYVVLRETGALSEQDIIDHVRSALAGYKKPKIVKFVDSLPTNAYGKIMKREIRSEL